MSQRGAVAQSRRRKLFTIQQADQALPLVRRIVADIVAQHRELEHLLCSRKRQLQQNRGKATATLDEAVAHGARQLNHLIDEVNAIGCELKDWETGQVDFRALYRGREVCLCWMLGEDSIRYWHELAAGAAARQPLDASFPQGQPRHARQRPAGAQDMPA